MRWNSSAVCIACRLIRAPRTTREAARHRPAHQRLATLTLAPLLWLCVSTALADTVDFEKQIAPILSRRCLACHNPQEARGALDLSTAQHLLRSQVLVPGEPSNSYLLDLVTPVDGRAEMPRDAEPLSPSEIRLLEQWVREGASWPQGVRLTEFAVSDRDWWSLQPLSRPAVPRLDSRLALVARNEIDAFVGQRLQQQGLTFSDAADRTTLIRRLTYDLIGLPPSPDDVLRFVEDPSPLAYERLVDRLLASPQYGERWARHWLDVAHYADSHGYDKDKPRPHAWPYRDYVIRSFNEDRPWAEFIQQQLAGDILQPQTRDGITATGFIAAGPWDFIGHAEVPETKIDGKVARNLDRDDMVATTIGAFSSLTVQCARCHHHKFDPIRQEHYYSLQAVFAALDRAERPYDADPRTAEARRELSRTLARQQMLLDELEERIEERKTPTVRRLEQDLVDLLERQRQSATGTVKRHAAYGYHSQVSTRADDTKWIELDLGSVHRLDDLLLFGAVEYGWNDFGFPEAYRVEVSSESEWRNPQLVAEGTAGPTERPGHRPVRIDCDGVEARLIRITATRLWERRRQGEPGSGDWIFALGEVIALDDSHQLPVHHVSSRDSIEASPRWSRQNVCDGILGAWSLDGLTSVNQADSPSNGYHSEFSDAADTVEWLQVDLEKTLSVDVIELHPAFPTDFADTPGFGFPLRFRIELSDDPQFESSTEVLAVTAQDFANPGNRVVRIPLKDRAARYVRLTATKLWDRGGAKHCLALAELRVWSGSENVSAGRRVQSRTSIESGRWSRRFAVDRHSSRVSGAQHTGRILALAVSDAPGELDRVSRQLRDELQRAVGQELLAQQTAAQQQLDRLREELAKLPPQELVYAGTVHEGQGSFRGRRGLGPRAIHILARGDVTRPQAEVGPGALPLIPQEDWRFTATIGKDEGQRRVALARWLTDPRHPLTWRSIANRVWQYHFGVGIVASPNDFGRMGELPTHPELLDWLATIVRDDGGSLKRLHRLIVLSHTYRQSSGQRPDAAEVDAGNRFLWRMNRRRLEAEAIRDAMLNVSGLLRMQMYGPAFQDFVLEKPQHSPHYEYEKFDHRNPVAHRRAVYRFLVRSQQEPFMETLDCADPSQRVGRRNETLTAAQALTLLNNQFVLVMSEAAAKRLKASSPDVRQQVRYAFVLSLGREPTADELERLTHYAETHGRQNLVRLLFNLNEFVFVD